VGKLSRGERCSQQALPDGHDMILNAKLIGLTAQRIVVRVLASAGGSLCNDFRAGGA
jgi:hypothetical protein